MKKTALVLALSIVSVSCLQSKAWSKSSVFIALLKKILNGYKKMSRSIYQNRDGKMFGRKLRIFMMLLPIILCITDSVNSAQYPFLLMLPSLLSSGRLNGIFIDSRAEGLKYKTSSGITGKTTSDGMFKYRPGDTVEFSVGNLSLGSVKAEQLVSVLNLENFSQAAMLLQALDDDQDPRTGIKITLADDAALSAQPFSLQQVNPDDENFKNKFKQVTGKDFAIVEYNSVKHSYSSIRIETLKKINNDMYKYYIGDLLFDDDYNKSKLENNIESRVRLYFWIHMIKPYYELCGKDIWKDSVASLDSNETIKKGIEYSAQAASVLNISLEDKTPEEFTKDVLKEVLTDKSIDFSTSILFSGSGKVEPFVKEFLNRAIKLTLPCSEAFFLKKRKDIFSCSIEAQKQVLDTINDARTSIALSQNVELMNSYTVALAWLDEWYWDANDIKFIAKKFGMNQYSNNELFDKIREKAIGLNASYDKELTESLISDAHSQINELTRTFFENTDLPRKISVPENSIDFDFMEPTISGNKLIFCYRLNNKINDTLSVETTFNVNPTALEYTPAAVSRTTNFLLDPLAVKHECATLTVNNLIQGQKNEDYINLSLQVKYKSTEGDSVETTDIKNLTYYFNQDISEYLKNSSDLIVSTSSPVTASPGESCPLTVRHDLPLSGQVSYSWRQLLTEHAWATVSIVNPTSAQASFVVPNLPSGSAQESLWFAVTVKSLGSGGDIQKIIRVIVKPDASAPTAAPVNLSASAGENSITFNWNAVSNADYYTLYISTQSGITPENYQSFADYRKINRIDGTSYEIPGLKNGTTYYAVVAAVKNFQESAASNEISATPAASLIGTVTSATGRIWMDRNLGASRVATSMTDTEAYGDLYQWGRGKDGHEKRTSGTTATLSSEDVPGHGLFIKAEAEPQDWRTPQNDSLWQGANGINNPCPAGFRLPTTEEWQAEMDSWNSKNAAGAFASPLKLVMTGVRSSDGTVYGGGDFGMYWSSNDSAFFVDSTNSYTTAYSRANGLGVRCIKD